MVKIISFFIAFIAVLSTMSLPGSPDTPVIINLNAENPYIAQYGEPMISAHRIGMSYAPQNTLMAFEHMLENSDTVHADVLEFDVQITLDGQLVMLHDLSYDKTTNAEEAFGRSSITPYFHTFDELQCLNLGENFKQNGEYPFRGLRGEDIPENLRVITVNSVLDYVEENCGDKKYYYVIEIKSPGLWGIQCADRLVGIIEALGITDRVILATFMPSVGEYVKNKYPHITRSAGIYESVEFYYYSRMGYDFNALDAGYSVLQLPYGKNVMPWRLEIVDFGTKELINYAHAYDIAVQYWTVNNAEDARYLTENGADALMGDDTLFLYETLAAIESEAVIVKSEDAAAIIESERNRLDEARQAIEKLLGIFIYFPF